MNSEIWKSMSTAEWAAFARSWFAELGHADGDAPLQRDTSSDRIDLADVHERPSKAVFSLNQTGSVTDLLHFIEAAFSEAQSDDHLAAIAAGPVEHVLCNHFDEAFPQIAEWAKGDQRFRYMLTGVWQQTMSDEQYVRVMDLQAVETKKPTDN